MNVSLTQTGLQKLDALRAFPDKVRAAVSVGMQRGAQTALFKVQRERFTGAGPFSPSSNRIGIISGRLRGSLLLSPPVTSATEITATVSTAVSYFPAHEFGFKGAVNVKAHARTRSRSASGKSLRKDGTPRKGDTLIETTGKVKAHTRNVDIPERRMLRTGLSEHLPSALSVEIERELLRVK